MKLDILCHLPLMWLDGDVNGHATHPKLVSLMSDCIKYTSLQAKSGLHTYAMPMTPAGLTNFDLSKPPSDSSLATLVPRLH
jgi:hypothetical protein